MSHALTEGTPDPAHGVYGISVAAELVGVGVQSLRLYEAKGLLDPDRTDGGTRRYSRDDVSRARRITDLLGSGVNLTGVAAILELEALNARLRRQIRALKQQKQERGRPDRRAAQSAL